MLFHINRESLTCAIWSPIIMNNFRTIAIIKFVMHLIKSFNCFDLHNTNTIYLH